MKIKFLGGKVGSYVFKIRIKCCKIDELDKIFFSSMFLEYRELKPIGKPKKLVVMLHGVGSNAQDLIDLAPYLAKHFPDAYFISPNGIEKYDLAPFGYQWFSLKDRSIGAMQAEINAKSPIVRKNIEDKMLELDLWYKDLILIGFSQGTMMSMDIAIKSNEKLCAVVGFSGAVIPPIDTDAIKQNQTPICMIHGNLDEVLHIDTMYKSADFLKSINFEVECFEIPNIAHSIDLKGLTIATDFIKRYY